MIPDPRDVGKVDTLRTDGFQCLALRAWSGRIQELAKIAPLEWTDWTEIKASTVRTIYRGRLPGPDGDPVDVHLKLFRAVRLSDRARDAIGGARSAREFHNLTGARERGLPCIEPLVAGSFHGSLGSRSFLLTRTEEGAALPRGPLPAADATAAGELLRQAHDAGLHARDLHPGNVLRRADGSLCLLDLTSAVLADPVPPPERGRALAFFCLDLDAGVLDPAARPLLAGYDADDHVRSAAAQASRRLRNRALSAFGRRAFRACRTTEVLKATRKPRVFLHVPSEPAWPAALAVIEDLDQREPVKSGRRGAVYLEGNLAIKTRTAANARRLFESAYWLQFAGVATPAPVALSTFKSQGTVAALRLPHPDVSSELAAGPLADADLHAAAANLGTSVGRLHSFGLRNRDLKFENLVRDPSTNTVYMVDLDGVKRSHPTDGRGRASDLGRVLAAFELAGAPGGPETVRRFLRAYVRTCRQLLYPVQHRRHVLDQARIKARAKTLGQAAASG